MEPPACKAPFSAEAGELHFLWGTPAENTIGRYNARDEKWTLIRTTGPPPPGSWNGKCAIIENHLYCFGGISGSSMTNDLHKLNLETFQWSKVNDSENISSDQPTCKQGCGLIAVNEETLVCFGGYCKTPTFKQPGSTFYRMSVPSGWTNEFHLFGQMDK